VLFDGAAGDDADLAQFDGIVDLRPRQFFVAVFGSGTSSHGMILVAKRPGCMEKGT
jgi:hypothetical protein